jgi:protein ImuB
MSVARAQSLVRDLTLAEAEPDQDREALLRLAQWIVPRFSPLVALDEPDGIWIDTTGCSHLFAGEEEMLADLVARLAIGHIRARAAIADTTGAAHAFARLGGANPIYVAPSGGGLDVLRALPVMALRIRPESAATLRRLGIETIGELEALPRAPLARRFGQDVLLRLDQAFGGQREPISPIEIPELVKVRRRFPEPTSTPEQLTRVIELLTAELCEVLAARHEGARRLDLVFRRVDGSFASIRIGTTAPSHAAKHLTKLLLQRLETIDPGFGIEEAVLSAPLTQTLEPDQIHSALTDENRADDLPMLIDNLANRIGANHLYRFEPVESDLPERSVRAVGALAPSTSASWPSELPRPVRMLERPEQVEALALLPDHAPAQFTWRGRRHRVTRADGPERVFGEWWTSNEEIASVRDYFQVEDEQGRRFWLFRAGDGEDPNTGSQRWWLHGMFG